MSAVKVKARDGSGNGGNVGALVEEEGLSPWLPVPYQVKHLSEGLEAGAVDQALVLGRLLLRQLGHDDHDLVSSAASLKEFYYRIGGGVWVLIEFIGIFVNKFNSN